MPESPSAVLAGSRPPSRGLARVAAAASSRFGRLLVLLLLAAFGRLGAFLNPVIDEDEAWYYVFGRSLVEGAQPYVGAVDLKPPLIYHWYASVLWLADSMPWVHAVTVLWVAATAHLLSRTVHAAMDGSRRDELAPFMAAASYLLFSATLWPKTFATNGEILMNLPVAACLYLFVRSRGQRSLLWLAACGAALGLAVLFKYQAGLIGPALVLFLFLDRRGNRAAFGGAAVLGLGAGAVVSAYLLYACSRGFAQEAWFWAWRYNFVFLEGFNWSHFWHELGVMGPRVLATWCGLWVAATIAVIRVGRQRRRDAELLFALCLFGASVAVAVGGKFFAHYFVQLLPFLALLAGPVVARAWRERRSAALGRRLWLAWHGITVLFVPVVMVTVLSIAEWRRDAEENALPRRIAAYADAQARADEPVFIWGRMPEVYYFSRCRPASRFFASNFLVGMNTYNYGRDVDPEAEARAWTTFAPTLMSDLKQSAPALLIDTSTAAFRKFDKYPLADFPELDAFRREAFAASTRIDGVTIYQRK